MEGYWLGYPKKMSIHLNHWAAGGSLLQGVFFILLIQLPDLFNAKPLRLGIKSHPIRVTLSGSFSAHPSDH